MGNLLTEVGRFQEWADNTCPPDQRFGEWECNYKDWGALHEGVLKFVAARPFESWSPEETQAVLYAIARDNEMQHLAREIRIQTPETLTALSQAALESTENHAKWQLAAELGHLGKGTPETERLLLKLARDEDEYVRRRSLQSLARVGAPALEDLALAEWHWPGENQQWTRMSVLWCLHRVGSPRLGPLLAAAEKDDRLHLSEYAKKVRRGDVEP